MGVLLGFFVIAGLLYMAVVKLDLLSIIVCLAISIFLVNEPSPTAYWLGWITIGAIALGIIANIIKADAEYRRRNEW